MTWGALARDVDTMRAQGPVVHAPYLGGFQTRDLAQITDDMIAQQGTGYLGTGLGLPPVFSVVRLIASTIDQLDLTVDGADPPPWLRSPRRYGSPFDLGDTVQWIVTSMALSGKAYLRCWLAGDDAWGTEPLHPNAVTPTKTEPRPGRRPELVYHVSGEQGDIYPVPPRRSEWSSRPQFILHVPYMITPDSPQGESPLTACRMSLLGYAQVERQASTLIDQGTYSGGRLETDQDITESTAKRYQDKWIENRREGKLPVLGAGLSYVNDLINPRDAQWLESRQFNMQQIAAMFGVPVDYLGLALIGGSSSLSYANAQDNDRRFRRNCLEAFTSQIEDALSLLTPPGRNPDESQPVRFDYDSWEASGANTATSEPANPGE